MRATKTLIRGTDSVLVRTRQPYQVFLQGLDHLFFSSLLEGESPEDRAETIETYLKSNGFSWNDVINIQLKRDN